MFNTNGISGWLNEFHVDVDVTFAYSACMYPYFKLKTGVY